MLGEGANHERPQMPPLRAQAHELLRRIDEMERCAGWTRFTDMRDEATSKPHPDDHFNGGQFTASVKRASMDLSRSLVEIRR